MSVDMLDLYVVRWPQHGLIKVGVSKNERWQDFDDGVELIFTLRAPRDVALAMEANVHERLSERHARPFRKACQAIGLLGTKGAGFTECYVDNGTTLGAVLEVLAAQGGLHLTLDGTGGDDYWDMDTYWAGYNCGWGAGLEATQQAYEGFYGRYVMTRLHEVVDAEAIDQFDRVNQL